MSKIKPIKTQNPTHKKERIKMKEIVVVETGTPDPNGTISIDWDGKKTAQDRQSAKASSSAWQEKAADSG
jgi:hypothetical protein